MNMIKDPAEKQPCPVTSKQKHQEPETVSPKQDRIPDMQGPESRQMKILEFPSMQTALRQRMERETASGQQEPPSAQARTGRNVERHEQCALSKGQPGP